MIACYNLKVQHPRGRGALLDDISLEIPGGAWAEILGEPGCGKSTLFSLLSLRARAEEGTVIVAGRNLSRMRGRRKLAALRRQVGSCAQRELLLEDRTVAENLLLPFVARGETRRAPKLVDALIDELALGELRGVRVGALTQRERRAVAIARACVGAPSLILVDGGLEGLEGVWRKRVRNLLRKLHREGSAVVLFGREPVGPMAGRGLELRLEDGQLHELERALHAPSPEAGGRRR